MKVQEGKQCGGGSFNSRPKTICGGDQVVVVVADAAAAAADAAAAQK